MPKHLALKANVACIHETHKTIANKKLLMGFGGLSVTIPLGLSAGGADRNPYILVFL